MATNVGQGSEGSVSVEDLDKCYAAVIQRRRTRGEQSIRTPEGFQRLHKRYQRSSQQDSTIAASESENVDRQNVLNVFFNPRISQVINDTCWRLALFGGGSSSDEMSCAGLELDAEKYSTFTFRLIQWIIPELPRRAVQELVQYDWELDRNFDDLGREGLSLSGFKLSLLDLAISCTDGTVSKCLEFLNLMSRWLQQSLPPYIRNPTPQVVEDLVEGTSSLKPPPKSSVMWNNVSLSMMTPFQIGPEGLYCELKAKICSAPMVIMVLAADENPLELVLTTRSKILLSKTEKHKNIYHKITVSDVLREEFRRQGCWAFCMNSKAPSVLLVPSSNINHQAKALYTCFREFDKDEHAVEPHIEVDERDNNKTSPNTVESDSNALSATLSPEVPSPVTIFTSVPEQCALRFGGKDKTCHKMERMSSRLFTIERRVDMGETFAITLTSSLLENTGGAAAVVSKTVEVHSTFTIGDNYTASDKKHIDAHTFVFVLKSSTSRRNGLRQDETTLPRQWFTSLSAGSETTTFVFESSPTPSVNSDDTNKANVSGSSADRGPQRTEIYQLFILTIHGVHIEVACNTVTQTQNKQDEGSDPDVEAIDFDDPGVLPMDSEVTSAGLLKELLLLQKMRQLEKTAEPPPDFVIGTQVSTTKPVTTAESLRSKILRSRQEERLARYQQLEDAVRIKILESAARRKNVSAVRRLNPSHEPPLSPNSELEKRVNVITTFFHEMAVHQPKVDELNGSSAAEEAEAVAEAQLIKTFGDMFDRDADLQNVLDEEKWSTYTAKVIRRRESISTNLPKVMPVGNIKETRDRIDESNIPWTFEDYESTAQYIEQLMNDVTIEATKHQELEEIADVERKQEVMKQLVASWQYTQHRVDKAATRKRLKEIEQKRRKQWMQSQHVQMYGDVASAKRSDKPERQVFILPKQRFLIQKHSIPSNAIWEVPGTGSQTLSSGPLATGLVSPVRPMSPRIEEDTMSPPKVRPQRPQRPATVTAAERPSDITALRSAAISRARVRRIRSAHSTVRGDSTTSKLQTRRIQSALSSRHLEQPEREEVPPRQEEELIGLEIPVAPLLISNNADAGVKEDNLLHDPNISTMVKSPGRSYVTGSPVAKGTSASPIQSQSTRSTSPEAADAKDGSTKRTPMKAVARKKKLKKKRRSKTTKDMHFQRRVLELVSISAKLQAVADEEWKETQGIASVEELSSVPCFPKHTTKPKPDP